MQVPTALELSCSFCQAQATKPAKFLLVFNNIHTSWKHSLILVGQGSLKLIHSVMVDHQILVVIVLDHCAACTLAGQNCLLKVPGHEAPCVIDAGH